MKMRVPTDQIPALLRGEVRLMHDGKPFVPRHAVIEDDELYVYDHVPTAPPSGSIPNPAFDDLYSRFFGQQPPQSPRRRPSD